MPAGSKDTRRGQEGKWLSPPSVHSNCPPAHLQRLEGLLCVLQLCYHILVLQQQRRATHQGAPCQHCGGGLARQPSSSSGGGGGVSSGASRGGSGLARAASVELAGMMRPLLPVANAPETSNARPSLHTKVSHRCCLDRQGLPPALAAVLAGEGPRPRPAWRGLQKGRRLHLHVWCCRSTNAQDAHCKDYDTAQLNEMS